MSDQRGLFDLDERYQRLSAALTKAGAIKTLFERFDMHLKTNGYLAMGGQIVDATIVQAPRQRMSNEEKQSAGISLKTGRSVPANLPRRIEMPVGR